MFTTTYGMERGGKVVAVVVVLGAGERTVVMWPTSTVVYDTEEAAQAVHIDHMGGRGERTAFQYMGSTSKHVERGMLDAHQDDCEGCGYASVSGPLPVAWREPEKWVRPDYISAEDEEEYFYVYSILANEWKRQAAKKEGRAVSEAKTDKIREALTELRGAYDGDGVVNIETLRDAGDQLREVERRLQELEDAVAEVAFVATPDTPDLLPGLREAAREVCSQCRDLCEPKLHRDGEWIHDNDGVTEGELGFCEAAAIRARIDELEKTDG